MITMDAGTPNPPDHPFGAAVALAVVSFICATSIMPVLYLHILHKNIGAISLTAWILYLNIQSIVNSIIWNRDDVNNHFNGRGLCHLEASLTLASQIGVHSSLFCMLRTLATVMRNAENPQLMQTTKQKITNMVIDLTCCIIPPALQIVLAWIVSPAPYAILGVAGCVPAPGTNWLTIVLLIVPPLIWCGLNTRYCCKLMPRL